MLMQVNIHIIKVVSFLRCANVGHCFLKEPK